MTTEDIVPNIAPVFLSLKELAEKYPVPNARNWDRWYYVCCQWEEAGDLKEGRDWRNRRQGHTSCREYREGAILWLVWNSQKPFPTDVRIAHRKTIAAILIACNVATPVTATTSI